MSQTDVKELRKIFDDIDEDSSGSIDEFGATASLREHLARASVAAPSFSSGLQPMLTSSA